MKKTFTHLGVTAFFLAVTFQLFSQNVNPIHVRVNTPGTVDWVIDGIQANLWGGDLNLKGPVSGDLAVARDTSLVDSVAVYICDSVLANPGELTGKVALISRGDCEFGAKALRAEQNGAIAAIIGNRSPIGYTVGGSAIGLIWMGAGAVGAMVTIPSVCIGYEDMAALRKLVDSGVDVNVTIEAPYLFDGAAAYAYKTPEEQIVPLDRISLVVLNRDTSTLYNFSLNATVTDPSGNETVLTVPVDSMQSVEAFSQVSGEYIATFDSYQPEQVGEYTVKFSAETATGDHPIDQEEYVSTFLISDDHTFAQDNGEVVYEEGVTLHPQTYSDSAAVFYIGNYFRTGEQAATATHVSFGLSNYDEMPEGYLFFLSIYTADNDANDTVDALNPAAVVEPVGTVTYALTGGEISNQIIFLELDEPAELEPNTDYVVLIDHIGTSAVPPAFTATGGPEHPDYFTVYQVGSKFEIDGWETWNDDTPGFPHGGRRPVIRMHLDGFVGAKDVQPLDASKISIQPVPTTDFVDLTLDLESVAEEVNVAVLDFSGKVIRTEKLENVHQGTYRFDVSNLANGMYFLSVVTPEGFRSKKFQVMR